MVRTIQIFISELHPHTGLKGLIVLQEYFQKGKKLRWKSENDKDE